MNALFGIHDTMQFVAPDVATICVGQAASAAAVLLAAGAPGQALRPAQRPGADPPAPRRRPGPVDRPRAADRRGRRDAPADGRDPRAATGQTAERITADIDRDYIVRGDEAVAYGLVDHIIERRQLEDARTAIAA